MKKQLLTMALGMVSVASSAQSVFNFEIDTAWSSSTIILPASPLTTQVLFIGGTDMVQTLDRQGNVSTAAPAKQNHDFIGFTPDANNSDLGWVSINHETVTVDPLLGDGGGMTAFKIKREGDTLAVVNQTLADGRSGDFFNVDFYQVGNTGINCGGISSADGRIWTSEEYLFDDNAMIAQFLHDASGAVDTADWTIPATNNTGFDGQVIKRFEAFRWMTEIDPINAKAIRKQYNWGRQNFEGGAVASDNKTVYLCPDNTPAFLSKFVATTAGDFTAGKLYVYKEDWASKWVEIDNTDWNKMTNYYDEAVAVGASMFNRLEWVNIAPNGKVYITETGRDYPGTRWADEFVAGGTFPTHTMDRAIAQGVLSPTSATYHDYYGRILELDPTTDDLSVYIEGGPDLSNNGQDTISPTVANYVNKHLSNPDGLNFFSTKGKDYMVICEDLNQATYGSAPFGKSAVCELYMLDMSITIPTYDDLIRIAVMPPGAEVTGAKMIDDKTLLVNVQHPSSANQFPFNNSLTLAINGFDKTNIGVSEYTLGEGFTIFPNPTTRELNFDEATDIAIYDMNGKRIRVYRNRKNIDVSDLTPGSYFIQNEAGQTAKFIVQ